MFNFFSIWRANVHDISNYQTKTFKLQNQFDLNQLKTKQIKSNHGYCTSILIFINSNNNNGLDNKANLKALEFFLNEFPWIQWTMTKSKSGLVTKRYYPFGNKYITSASNIKCIFITISGYISVANHHCDRYQPMDGSGNFLFTTTSRGVSNVRSRMSLVTILLLDFVMIHWIGWIQRRSFRENSIVSVHCAALLEHVIKITASYFDTGFISQIKLTTINSLLRDFRKPELQNESFWYRLLQIYKMNPLILSVAYFIFGKW